VLVAIVALVVMRPTLTRPDPAVMKVLLISGATLLPTFAAAWALNVADRLFLVRVVTTEQLGFYAIANKVASLLGVAMAPVYAAWTPLALSLPQTAENQQRMGVMSRYLVGAATIGGLGLGLFAQEILLVLGRTPYVPAAPYVGLLVYVHVISALGTVLYALAVGRKQLAAISGTVVAGALINVTLNFALIPRFGLWGATVATVVGYAIPQALLYARLRKGGDVPVPMTKIILAMGLAFAIYVVSLSLSALPGPAQIALKLMLLLIFPVGLVGIGIVTRYELRQGLAAARQRLSLRPLKS
jgi:O-antigen/teichoic acid export membrane protein